jgi:hypothetical protein
MIEKFSVRDHGSILEILAKASSDKMYMYPCHVLACKYLEFEVLRVSLYDAYQLLLLFLYLCSLSFDTLIYPFILEVFKLFRRPESYIIYLFGQIFK